jgi:hypothetical protein
MSKRQYKNFVILHNEIFERKKKVGKNKFYNQQKQVKNCITKYVLKIKELNVRIAIPQLIDNKQVYEEMCFSFITAPNQNENFYALCFC